MGPITYSLCQKPILGVAMWLASACAIPALFTGAPINLAEPASKVVAAFNAPIDLTYSLGIRFDFESTAARLSDEIVDSYGSTRCGTECTSDERWAEERKHPLGGRPIPFKVVIRNAADRSIVVDQTFTSFGRWSHINATKDRKIGLVTLKRGKYTAEIVNLEAQAGLENVKTTLFLVLEAENKKAPEGAFSLNVRLT
jgi:Domain of unknown function (DUF5625)